jgi:hypothetical protein
MKDNKKSVDGRHKAGHDDQGMDGAKQTIDAFAARH